MITAIYALFSPFSFCLAESECEAKQGGNTGFPAEVPDLIRSRSSLS